MMGAIKSIFKTILDLIFSIFLKKDETKENWHDEAGLVANSLTRVPIENRKPRPDFRLPVDTNAITSRWGWRKLPGMKRRFHHGIDYSGRLNEFAYAICPAVVTRIKLKDEQFPCKWEWTDRGWKKLDVPAGRGWTPWIELTALHDENLKFYYMHGEPLVTLDDKIVYLNSPIYRIDNYGNSQGAHLHFGVKKHDKWINPVPFLKKRVKPKEVT